nr:uncharacterized protein LOC113805626 isoform X3 [Penaeus vannamei]
MLRRSSPSLLPTRALSRSVYAPGICTQRRLSQLRRPTHTRIYCPLLSRTHLPVEAVRSEQPRSAEIGGCEEGLPPWELCTRETLSWRTCRTPSPPPPRRPPHHTPPTTVSERPRPRPPNSTLSHSQHHPSPHKVYHQERVEEVRTEQRSSGGGKMASLNNNLSELDTLLQDLNNARYTGVFKEPAAATNGTVNGSRPTVDSLLDALDDVDTG